MNLSPITSRLCLRRVVANVLIVAYTLVFAMVVASLNPEAQIVGALMLWAPIVIVYGTYVARLTCPECGQRYGCWWERNATQPMPSGLFFPFCVPTRCPHCGYSEIRNIGQ